MTPFAAGAAVGFTVTAAVMTRMFLRAYAARPAK